MTFSTVMERLRSFAPPEGWPGQIFLFPPDGMQEIYDCVLSRRFTHCLELGTGFGATAVVIAAALEEIGEGTIVTVDRFRHQPVNVGTLLGHVNLPDTLVEIVAEPLGYNWWLADRLIRKSENRSFDLCFLDGAHEFEIDALAFVLASHMLKRGGMFVLDDLNFHLRQVPDWHKAFGDRSARELDTAQVKLVWDLLVTKSQAFHRFRITCDGRVGWAQKRTRFGELASYVGATFPRF